MTTSDAVIWAAPLPGHRASPSLTRRGSPKTDDDLTATWTASTDADGDAITYAYQWLRDGSAVAGQSGTTSEPERDAAEGADDEGRASGA